MGSNSDNHNLYRPSKDETGWGGKVSNNFSTIEKRLVIRDAEANRSNYTPHEDATFVATDTGAVYDGDGVNWNAASREFQSVGLEQLSLTNGPVEVSSNYSTIQAALDAAAGGLLLINDTKREESIQLSTTHNGTTIEWVGGNSVDKPSTPTDGEATFRVADNLGATVDDITFVRPRIRNPDLADVDIGNEDTVVGSSRRSAIEAYPPAGTYNTFGVTGWRIVDPEIHHVQGYGIGIQHPISSLDVEGGHVYQTAFDGFYSQSIAGTSENAAIRCDGVLCEDNGRHNFAVAGDAVQDSVHISGTGKRAYTAGVDLEHARRAVLDVTIYEPDQGGKGGNIQSGLNFSYLSEDVSGRVHVVDANGHSANLAGVGMDDLTVTWEQSNAQNPAGNPEVHIRGNATGSVTVVGSGGGAGYAAVDVNGPGEDVSVDATVYDAYGASMRVFGNPNADIRLTSIDPVQGGLNVTAEQRTHLFTDGGATDITARLKAVDNDGNAEHAISSGGAADDWNQYIGNARGAFSDTAVSGVGANTDTTRLITG